MKRGVRQKPPYAWLDKLAKYVVPNPAAADYDASWGPGKLSYEAGQLWSAAKSLQYAKPKERAECRAVFKEVLDCVVRKAPPRCRCAECNLCGGEDDEEEADECLLPEKDKDALCEPFTM